MLHGPFDQISGILRETIQSYIMSSQLNRRSSSSHRRSVVHNKILVFDTMKCGNERLVILKTPSVEAEVMWKTQSFDFATNFLRGKRNTKVSADSVIAVIREHYPMPTMSAE